MKKVKLELLASGKAEIDPNTGELLPVFSHRDRSFSPTVTFIVKEVQRELGLETLDADDQASFTDQEISSVVDRVAERLGFELSAFERDAVTAYIDQGSRPFGLLQDLVDCPDVSDIIVTHFAKIDVQRSRKNCSTELSFPNQDSYESFVERLLQRAGATYSTKKPIADGMIGGLARVHAVHSSLCEAGPYLTIRLNRFSSVQIADLVGSGLAPEPVFDYLRGIIRSGSTIFVAGEVGTGKTTLIRALAASIPRDQSILVIEDTPEIQLEHPHVRYLRTREANSDGAGRIAPSECIRAGMRMAMNRIIFGEIRDAEAAEAFIDVCASGHPGLSTIHAKSSQDAVARLELFLGRAQKGVAKIVLTEQVATAVQVIVHIDICRETGRRRVMEVREIGPVADNTLRQREMFRYQVTDGIPMWKVVTRVSGHRSSLEQGAEAMVLSQLPAMLEQEATAMYHEAAFRRTPGME